MGQSDVEIGKAAFGGSHEFIGVSDLAPIHDEFEDGAEILWEEIWPDASTPDDCPLEVFSEAEMESLYENTSETDDLAMPAQQENK